MQFSLITGSSTDYSPSLEQKMLLSSSSRGKDRIGGNKDASVETSTPSQEKQDANLFSKRVSSFFKESAPFESSQQKHISSITPFNSKELKSMLQEYQRILSIRRQSMRPAPSKSLDVPLQRLSAGDISPIEREGESVPSYRLTQAIQRQIDQSESSRTADSDGEIFQDLLAQAEVEVEVEEEEKVEDTFLADELNKAAEVGAQSSTPPLEGQTSNFSISSVLSPSKIFKSLTSTVRKEPDVCLTAVGIQQKIAKIFSPKSDCIDQRKINKLLRQLAVIRKKKKIHLEEILKEIYVGPESHKIEEIQANLEWIVRYFSAIREANSLEAIQKIQQHYRGNAVPYKDKYIDRRGFKIRELIDLKIFEIKSSLLWIIEDEVEELAKKFDLKLPTLENKEDKLTRTEINDFRNLRLDETVNQLEEIVKAWRALKDDDGSLL